MSNVNCLCAHPPDPQSLSSVVAVGRSSRAGCGEVTGTVLVGPRDPGREPGGVRSFVSRAQLCSPGAPIGGRFCGTRSPSHKGRVPARLCRGLAVPVLGQSASLLGREGAQEATLSSRAVSGLSPHFRGVPALTRSTQVCCVFTGRKPVWEAGGNLTHRPCRVLSSSNSKGTSDVWGQSTRATIEVDWGTPRRHGGHSC